MLTLTKFYIGAIAVVALVFFFAAKSRARRIQGARPREVSPEQRRENEEEMRRLLASGRKIEAIKNYRAFYHVGLKEAKEAVELFDQQKA